MIRSFKYVSLTSHGSPQPVFGTTLGAATGPATSNVGGTQSASVNSQVTVQVADSSFFLAGDLVNFDVGASEEKTSVVSVTDGTHIVVAGLTKSHAISTYVRLAMNATNVYIQTPDGNTGPIWIGTKSTMATSTGVFCLKKLLYVAANAIPTDLLVEAAGFPGPLSLAEFFFDGTTNGDKILPSCVID